MGGAGGLKPPKNLKNLLTDEQIKQFYISFLCY